MANSRDAGSEHSPATVTFIHPSSQVVASKGLQGETKAGHWMATEDSVVEGDLSSALLSPETNLNPLANVPSTNRRRLDYATTREMIRRFGDYLAYCVLLTMLVLIPLILYRALSNRKLDLAAFSSARVMVIGTVILSLRLVYLHLTHWYMPEVQKYVVRILWMVPIYAVQSYLSLRYHELRIYIGSIRDFYEAYVIASFVYYLIELLGGEESLIHILQQKTGTRLGKHSFPFSLILQPWEMGIEFMLQCKHGVLQYVVFKTLSTVTTFACESAGIYGEGKFDWRCAYPYLCFFQNISVMYALYCLVMFYHAINEELRHPVNWHPLGKFLSVKSVVFFTWWQGVLIFYLRAHGIIEHMGSWSSEDVANGLIDYCVIVETIGFAIAHSYTFSYKEYLPGSIPDESLPGAPNESNMDGSGSSRGQTTYRPPATLVQPMKFKDAFWSSTVPRETFEDIQRLRTGIDGAISKATNPSPGSISLRSMNDPRESDTTLTPPELSFV
jgi:hypothetical protein